MVRNNDFDSDHWSFEYKLELTGRILQAYDKLKREIALQIADLLFKIITIHKYVLNSIKKVQKFLMIYKNGI